MTHASPFATTANVDQQNAIVHADGPEEPDADMILMVSTSRAVDDKYAM